MLDYLTSPQEPRWTRWLLLAFIPLALLYYVAGKGNGETKNHVVTDKDQKVYLNTAYRIAHDPLGYMTPRQRTPGYPYFLSLFYSKEKFDMPEGSNPRFAPGWFERGKSINLVLSMCMLGGLFLFSRWRLPIVESGIITVASGLLLFTYKAGYVQPELTYWVLNTILFVLMGRMLLKSGWWIAVLCGLLSVVTYFVKAGTQPLLFLFSVTWVIKVLWDHFSYRRRKGRGLLDEGEEAPRSLRVAGQGALVVAIFFVLLIPYLHGTQKVFGKPFYSVYTEYMMWLPLEEGGEHFVDKDYMWAFYGAGARERLITIDEFNTELEERVRKRVLKQSKGKLSEAEIEAEMAAQYHPLDELPSASMYLKRHTMAAHVGRVQAGLARTGKRMSKYYRRATSMLTLVGKVALVGLALRVLLFLWQRFLPRKAIWIESLGEPSPLKRLLGRSPYLVFYALGFFCGYLVLYAWYDALRIDARLMLSLYLPALFSAVLAVRFLFDGLVLRGAMGGRSLYLGKVANVFLLVMLAYLSIRFLGGGELYDLKLTEP